MVTGYFQEPNVVPTADRLNFALSQIGDGAPPREWAVYRGLCYIDRANRRLYVADGTKWLLKVGADLDRLYAQLEHTHEGMPPTSVSPEGAALSSVERTGSAGPVITLSNMEPRSAWVIMIGVYGTGLNLRLMDADTDQDLVNETVDRSAATVSTWHYVLPNTTVGTRTLEVVADSTDWIFRAVEYRSYTGVVIND